MKKIKLINKLKTTISLALVLLTILSVSTFPVAADDYGVMPCFNNVFVINTDFSISQSGLAAIFVSYDGYEGITTGAKIEIKLQRKTWGLFWTNVDTWTRIPGTVDFSDCVTHQLTRTGTYRAIVTYEIRGTAGDPDTYTFDHEMTY